MSIICVQSLSAAPFDCECCGSCYPEGVRVMYDGVTVWERYSDGHMGGHQTEVPLLQCLLEHWHVQELEKSEKAYSEAGRQEWNQKYPGNGIARTVESWAQERHSHEAYLMTVKDTVREHCRSAPYAEHLQCRLFALWLEDACGQVIEVQQGTASEEEPPEEYYPYEE